MQDTFPLVYVGVTIISAEMGLVVVFIAVKEGILPDPEDANPMVGLSLTQE